MYCPESLESSQLPFTDENITISRWKLDKIVKKNYSNDSVKFWKLHATEINIIEIPKINEEWHIKAILNIIKYKSKIKDLRFVFDDGEQFIFN
jgi:predicted transcriptional regulator